MLGAPIDMPATDNTKWHVDWSQVPTDSFGNPIDFSKIKSMRYSSVSTRA